MTEDAHRQAERTRLIRMMDAYLDALFARQPGRIPMATHFRSTEDGQPLPPGSGIWRTLRNRKKGAQYFVDTQTGHIEFWGLADEMGADAMLSIRLKTEGRVIAEAETIVARRAAYFEPANVFADSTAAFHAPVAPEMRASRADLIGAANAYFDAIELADGSRLNLRDDVRRLVNGVVDSADDPSRVEQGEEQRAISVQRQISEGHYSYIEALRDRRYPIVDTERGLVLCHVIFDHPGDLPRADGHFPIRSPNSMIFTEVFKIAGGRIEEIWALGANAMPYGAGSGW